MREIEGKPADMILYLYKSGTSTVTEIAKQTSSTYAHAVRVISKLGRLGLVRFERRGRTKQIELTEIGKKIGERLDEIKELLRLAQLETEVERVYTTEVKGKLREEINQREVLNKLAETSKSLETASAKREMLELALKLQARIEEIEREVKGLVVG